MSSFTTSDGRGPLPSTIVSSNKIAAIIFPLLYNRCGGFVGGVGRRYSQAKEGLVAWAPSVFASTSSISTMFCGSLASSFWAVGASMPLDVVKSR
jgi:hypothetical protein